MPNESTPPGEGGEQRRAPRYHVELPATVSFEAEGKVRKVRGEAMDISIFGLKLFIPADLPIRTVITIELTVPYSVQPVTLTATVLNRRSYHYGVSFNDPDENTQRAIERACSALSILR
jgi:hypothetical protein